MRTWTWTKVNHSADERRAARVHVLRLKSVHIFFSPSRQYGANGRPMAGSAYVVVVIKPAIPVRDDKDGSKCEILPFLKWLGVRAGRLATRIARLIRLRVHENKVLRQPFRRRRLSRQRLTSKYCAVQSHSIPELGILATAYCILVADLLSIASLMRGHVD